MATARALPPDDELRAIVAELRRRSYLTDPDGADRWIRERLGEATWSKQREILSAIQSHRRVAVPSSFATGKSWLAARIAAYWIENHPPGQASVITTATTHDQVRGILWQEISRAHDGGKLIGYLNQTEWWVTLPGEGKPRRVGFGRKPSEMNPTAFQGYHNVYQLVIVDEAAGVPESLMNALEGLIVNETSRILLIGNPEQGGGTFEKACSPGSGYHVVRINAFDTPNFTGEPVSALLASSLVSRLWVEEKKQAWGEDSPMYRSKVLAEFPETDEYRLIPLAWIRAAQERRLTPTGLIELGVDVGIGGDRNVVALRRGPVVRVIRRDQQGDTMATVGNITEDLRRSGAMVAKIDKIGVGKGCVDRGRELGRPFLGINVGERASDDEQYANQRAEFFWGLRERFRTGDIDLPGPDEPGGEDLAAQLLNIRYKRNSRGQVVIESKDEIRRRTKGKSPDEADAVMLAFATPPKPEATASAVLPNTSQSAPDWQRDYYRRR